MEIIQGDWPTGKSDINDLTYLPICSCDICIQENNKIILQKEHKYCRFCKTIKPEKDFVSLKFNKTTYTYRCISCRDKLLIQRMGGSRDRCKKLYKYWFIGKTCMRCNSADSLQADHGENKMNKVMSCSNYSYWPSNGGEQALQDESDKCTVKCYGCHKTQSDFELQRENQKKRKACNNMKVK